MGRPRRRPASGAMTTTAQWEPPTALVSVSGSTNAVSAHLCASCGADLAGRRRNVRFCDKRCTKRAARGMAPAGRRATRYTVALSHPTYSVEPCPKCGHPEADGGACADCGWTLPRPGTPGGWPLHPAGTVHGPMYGNAAGRPAGRPASPAPQ